MSPMLAAGIANVMQAAYSTGLFVSSASFTAPVQIQGATGNSIGGTTPIAGLQNIACMDAPDHPGLAIVGSGQKRNPDYIEASRDRHVLLKAYFSQLDTGFDSGASLGYQVTITGPNGLTKLYQFLGGEGDSQFTQTRCNLRLVTI